MNSDGIEIQDWKKYRKLESTAIEALHKNFILKNLTFPQDLRN